MNLLVVLEAFRAAARAVTLTVADGEAGAYPELPQGAVIAGGATPKPAAALPGVVANAGCARLAAAAALIGANVVAGCGMPVMAALLP